jgi:Ni/Co efflux regulator RcnB
MRNIFLSILLASAVASPALAEDRGWHHGQQQDANQQDNNHQQAREAARAERANNGNNEARVQGDRGARFSGGNRRQAAPQIEQRQIVDQGQRGGWDRSRFEGRTNVTQQVQVQQQAEQQQRAFRNGNRGGYTGAYSGRQTEQVQQAQRYGGWSGNRSGWSGQAGDYRQRQAVQSQAYDRSRSGSWNRDWRNDRRYDWRSYRNNHRSIFQLGVYFDPFGYGYRPVGIGYNLGQAYFGQQYWIDPGMYQLPYPPPGTQWVRYWNDAVLVDMYTGQVVDVINNFFW